jgi:long-chain acyl-CoA synthetase
LLFIGDANALESIVGLQMDIPLVTFFQHEQNRHHDRFLTWEAFLAHGTGARNETMYDAPVGFTDVATIRYSSGTTGTPRGAVFVHEQLRWMGEVIASLPSWPTRNKPISYVSFLPMNHVVEGILAMYSPYYAPAPVDLFFVENLVQLPKALKQGRPTVFFSVPRVYEKLFEQVRKSRIGRRYLTMSEGVMKRIVGKLIRAQLLQKAGLNRCGLFIVGSAPVNTTLLKGFRGLGIEIHNAYGLTEAPLVTINRLGTNRLGTVGEPLPNTTVRIDDRGVVRVQGPQVATSYFGEQKHDLLEDGSLATGDIGCLTAEGSLVLTGRASEMIVTSYGKSIHPGPVEALLKRIPAVDEALLVGEGRPFCAALLWINPSNWDSGVPDRIRHTMKDLERELSAPARPKRWAILINDLAVETGELTPNYKVRRRAVLARHAQVVAALYREGSVPEHVLGLDALEERA